MRFVNSFACAALLAAVAMVFAAPAEAQVRLGIGGGPSFPLSDFGDHVDTGFHVQGEVALGLPLMPIGIRGDVAFNRFPANGHDDDVISGTLNGVLDFGIGLVRGYTLAGLGIYHLREEDESETNVGINIGLGGDFWFGPVRPFIEVRYHHAFSDVEDIQYVPLTFGLRF